MSEKKQSIDKLIRLFKEKSDTDTEMMLKDSFAAACYLCSTGKNKAGRKLLKQIFACIGWSRNATYFSDFLKTFELYASEYAIEVMPHSALHQLFIEKEKEE